jgi:hypothetical protein
MRSARRWQVGSLKFSLKMDNLLSSGQQLMLVEVAGGE